MYTAYRKAGYSKAFLEAHREKITLHKAAKAAFDEAEMQKLPKVKELDAEFVAGAKEEGMINLKGHRSIGGIRASIYNAMPEEGVDKLIAYMKKFEKQHS